MVAVNYKKSIADAKIADDKRAGEAEAINLLEQIFPLPENSPKRKALITELIALPPGSVAPGMLKDVLEPKPAKEAESNQGILFNLIDGIYNGTITDSSQIKALVGKGITGKDGVAVLKLLQSEDKRDSSTLDRAISQLAGIPVIPGSVVMIDPKGEEFKRRNELKAEALQIESAAAAKGQVLTPRDIITQLEDGVAKKRNTESAKAAKKSLEIYEKKSWVNGPITRDTLPALERKAGTDRNKVNELNQIKKLLNQAEGGR
jgi:hypothetical protein